MEAACRTKEGCGKSSSWLHCLGRSVVHPRGGDHRRQLNRCSVEYDLLFHKSSLPLQRGAVQFVGSENMRRSMLVQY